MSEVYSDVRSLDGKPKEGNDECVTLVKNLTAVGWTGKWRQGDTVVGNNSIQQGTAIATFIDGRYANQSHGNHAALYVGQVTDGIYVMDQWRSKPKIGKRFIRRKGKDAHGRFIDPSNNADAFFVIECAMKIRHTLIVTTLGLFFQNTVHAAPRNFSCPQSIPEASVRLLAPSQEWTPFVASPLYLSGAAPADGPPERLGVLRESSSKVNKTETTQKYSLVGTYPDGKWLRCDYGSFGEMSLAKRLPDDVQECTIVKKQGVHAGENQIMIRCL